MKSKNFKFKKNCQAKITNNYLTHGIHSYTAKFIPQIPRFFIEKYSKEGEIVLDPMAGSGTTLLEANVMGRHSLGADINPLARLIAKVKTTPIKPRDLKSAIKKLDSLLSKKLKLSYDVDFPNKEYWFSKKSIKELRKIMTAINILYDSHEINKKIKNFFEICFSSIIRKSSYADPRNPKTYCSPKMQEKRNNGEKFYPIRLFKETLRKYSKSFEELYEITKNKKIKTQFIKTNDSRNIKLPPKIKKVDLIITSPPYANAQEYFRNFKLELFWLKKTDRNGLINLDKNQIGGENHAALNYKKLHKTGFRKIDKIVKEIYLINKKSAYIVHKYFYNMEKTIIEYDKVLKKNRHCIIIIGNNTVREVKIPISETLIKIAQKHGFKLYDYGYDLIQNRRFMTKRNNGAEIIDRDWVIDLIKK